MNKKSWKWKLKKTVIHLHFRHWPILVKFSACLSIAFLIMILLFAFNFNYYKDDRMSSTFQVIHNENLQTVDKIEEYVKDLRNITRMPLNDIFVDYDFVKGLNIFNRTGVTDYDFQKACDSIFNEVFNFKPDIHSVFIFNLNGDSEYKMKNGSLYKNFNPKGQNWFAQAIEQRGVPVLLSTFRMPFVSDMKDKPVYVFSLARSIVDVRQSTVGGVILVNVNINFLKEICRKMMITPGQQIIVLDQEGKMVYDTASEGIAGKVNAAYYLQLAQNGVKEQVMHQGDQKYLVSCASSPETGWIIVNQIPMNALLHNINALQNKTYIATVILIIGVFALLFVITRFIVLPITRLSAVMQVVSKGDFTVKSPVNSRDETGTLSRAFNNMIQRLNHLVNVIYHDNLKKKELEIQVLQSQINPHFLYNALESIHMMAEINNDSETSQMALSLGKFLRYGISRRTNMVKVREELAHLTEYINLQKARFDNELEVVVDIEKKILDYVIVKLILQPLVENSINHGFDDLQEKYIITIKGYIDESQLVLQVIDNGQGMEMTQVQQLTQYINDMESSQTSIGLRNVNMRLQLYYGEHYGLKIHSTKGYGTTVTITLPYVE